MSQPIYYIGVDVGSYSVRSAIFNCLGDNSLKLINKKEIPIKVYNDMGNIFEQSSENIWQSICKAVKESISNARINIEFIKGIGFDATCSLVALDKRGRPLSVSKSNYQMMHEQIDIADRNIIMWMDIRATAEAEFINSLHLNALNRFGGKISVEMQPPKLMWLKKNIPGFMSNIGYLFDLPDYLVFRATGTGTRSICSVTCKWAFDSENMCWDKEFWENCNLSELCDNDFAIIGNQFGHPGDLVGSGLSEKAAEELGLKPNIQIPVSLIDAYAGVLGAMTNSKQLITIAGTSACHMIVVPNPVYINGIWGPYKNALIKDYYVLEAGQITVGNLLDRILKLSAEELSHSEASSQLLKMINDTHSEDQDIINLPSDKWYQINILTKDIHVNPDFAGNRNPRSDSEIRGSIIGLNIDSSKMFIAKLYLATIQAIMYGFKEILDKLLVSGIYMDSIVLCGGLSRNSLFSRVLADVSGFPVILTHDEDLVLLGAAKLNLPNIHDLFQKHNYVNAIKINPNISLKNFHQQKFLVYKRIIDFQCGLKDLIRI